MKLDKSILKTRSKEILNTIKPKFLANLIKIKELPKNKQIEAAAKALNPSALEKAGIKIPEGVHFGSCRFEEAEEFGIESSNSENRTPIIPNVILQARAQEPRFIDELRERSPELFEQIIIHLRSRGGEISSLMYLPAGTGIHIGIGSGRIEGALKESLIEAKISHLQSRSKQGYDEIIKFVTTNEFKAVYNELMDLPIHDRPKFVVEVLLNDIELQNRGVNRPDNLLILRSSFGDKTPALFCVKRWLPKDLYMFWENVNIIFSNDSKEVSEGTNPWGLPAPIAIQHEYLSGRLTEADRDNAIDSLELITELGSK